MSNVTVFPNQTYTPEQALLEATSRQWSKVLVIGLDENGKYIWNCSDMVKSDVVYLAEITKLQALGV